MPANRDPPPPLVILLLALLSGNPAFATPSEVSGTNHTVKPRGRVYDNLGLKPDDYYSDYDDHDPLSQPNPAPSQSTAPKICDYDVCLELQLPCSQLANCLCPGISLGLEVPAAPTLKRLYKEGSEVVVRWCAPYSIVTHYQVVVDAQEPLEFAEGKRTGAVGKVERGMKVCVVAVNNAGVSAPTEFSCMIYKPPEDNNVALKAGLIGGALGFLLLLSLGVLLWRLRARRKADARISTRDTDDTL